MSGWKGGKAAYIQRSYDKRRQRLDALKAGPCVDCGGTFPPECMDFDHRDPATKSHGVGHMYSHSLANILDEIAKCDLICANCHRIRTYRRTKS